MRRKLSLLVIITLLAALAIENGCSRPSDPDADEANTSPAFDLNDPKLQERLGEDDGYAFAIMYGADIHGSLETCG